MHAEEVLGTRIHRHPATGRQIDPRRAERRLRSVERRLRKDPAKQREYSAVIEEYLRNGWAEEVTTQIGQP
ncbi:Guanine nucleotide exchange factor, partial [Trichinella spiralis]